MRKLLNFIQAGSDKHISTGVLDDFSKQFEIELDRHIDERIRKYGKDITRQH